MYKMSCFFVSVNNECVFILKSDNAVVSKNYNSKDFPRFRVNTTPVNVLARAKKSQGYETEFTIV